MQTFAPRGNIFGPILPQFVLETSMSCGAKVMYALLCNYASENDHCWPSQVTLATRLSCSVSSVKNYLTELVGAKLITIRREQYRSSVYYMLRPENAPSSSRQANSQVSPQSAPVRPGAKSDCSQPTSDLRQPDSACTQPKFGYLNNLNKQEENTNPPLPPVRPVLPEVTSSPPRSALGGVSSPDFEKLWEIYPKKEAKGLARAAWLHLKRLGQLPALEKIEASIRHFMATESWQREQGRFVPQMGNWLKGQRWLDAPAVVAVQETAKTQQAAKAFQAMQQAEEALKAAQAIEREALRPHFETFAEKFQIHTKPWIRPMAFGLWMHLHGKHRAPTPSDVPKDNSLGITEFLQAFKRRCEGADWQKAHDANKQSLRPVSGAFADTRSDKALSCGEILTNLPVFLRQPIYPAFARAM